MDPKRFVYILRSDTHPDRHYVGVTSDVERRLDWHNSGATGHTTEHRPWSLLVVLEFSTEQSARRFERYLKSGSGRAFAKRDFDSSSSGPQHNELTLPVDVAEAKREHLALTRASV
jgi:putative endonuclease